MSCQKKSVLDLTLAPAQNVALLIDLDACQAHSTELRGQVLGPLGFVEGRRGNFGDGHLRLEGPRVIGFDVGQSLLDIAAIQQGIVGEPGRNDGGQSQGND